jgi:hypothetical protein
MRFISVLTLFVYISLLLCCGQSYGKISDQVDLPQHQLSINASLVSVTHDKTENNIYTPLDNLVDNNIVNDVIAPLSPLPVAHLGVWARQHFQISPPSRAPPPSR